MEWKWRKYLYENKVMPSKEMKQNLDRNLNPYKDVNSLQIKWKSHEHQKIIIVIYLGK